MTEVLSQIISFPPSSDFCCLLITFANSMDPDKDQHRGGSRISGKGVHIYKGMGCSLLILSHFSKISLENEIISFSCDI